MPNYISILSALKCPKVQNFSTCKSDPGTCLFYTMTRLALAFHHSLPLFPFFIIFKQRLPFSVLSTLAPFRAETFSFPHSPSPAPLKSRDTFVSGAANDSKMGTGKKKNHFVFCELLSLVLERLS